MVNNLSDEQTTNHLPTDYMTLYRAWQSFKKGKRLSHAIDEFAYHLEINLTQLADKLTNRSYHHGGYQPWFCTKRNDVISQLLRCGIV